MKIWIAIALLVAGCKKNDEELDESYVELATATAKKYAYEAYPSWYAVHDGKSCPSKLEELNEYTNMKNIKDPWGGEYKMHCGGSLPSGAKGIMISSPGPDGREGTPDDIRVW